MTWEVNFFEVRAGGEAGRQCGVEDDKCLSLYFFGLNGV